MLFRGIAHYDRIKRRQQWVLIHNEPKYSLLPLYDPPALPILYPNSPSLQYLSSLHSFGLCSLPITCLLFPSPLWCRSVCPPFVLTSAYIIPKYTPSFITIFSQLTPILFSFLLLFTFFKFSLLLSFYLFFPWIDLLLSCPLSVFSDALASSLPLSLTPFLFHPMSNESNHLSITPLCMHACVCGSFICQRHIQIWSRPGTWCWPLARNQGG